MFHIGNENVLLVAGANDHDNAILRGWKGNMVNNIQGSMCIDHATRAG